MEETLDRLRIGIWTALLTGTLIVSSGDAHADKKFCLTVGDGVGERYCGLAERDCRSAATGGTSGTCVEDTSSSDSSAAGAKPRKKKSKAQ
jgi:hypothetical protein